MKAPPPRDTTAPPLRPERSIPSLERVVQALGACDLPRPLVVAEARRVLQELRDQRVATDLADATARLQAAVAARCRARLRPVINATGVLLHTNLGRAPLSAAAVTALTAVARDYSNLEFDLDTGERGHRGGYLERSLAIVCNAPAATVVNNCAAALVLALRHLTARRPEVIVSRGELVQIGGGFRVPEILESSGARLREVGTTNRTAVADYARAVGEATGLILVVHRSNFYQEGFVASPALADLVALGRRHGVPVMVDLGSGALVDTERIPGAEHEPTPAEILSSGVNLVAFSGDKLVGGPQAGVLAGDAKLIGALKRDPLFRALRCDKLVLAAFEATIESYLAGDPAAAVPLHAAAAVDVAMLTERARRIVSALEGVPATFDITASEAEIGGGCLPRSRLPSVAIDVDAAPIGPEQLRTRLALQPLPVVATIVRDHVRLDLRTIFPRHDRAVVAAVRAAVSGAGEASGTR